MKKIKIKSEFDGLELSIIILTPKNKARGIVQISHGMAEHKERYLPFMKFLTEAGYISIINDHRGHGESIKSKEDLGYFYDETATAIVEDLHQITKYIKKEYPNLPLYLFGHSMGSMVVREYIKKYDNDISKLIVCGSPSKNYISSLAYTFVKLLIFLKDDRYRSKFIQEATFGDYNENIKNPQSPNSWLCADENVVKNYDSDELCGFTFTLNGFLNLFQLNHKIYKKKGYLVNNPKLSILFIAGTDDAVIADIDSWQNAQDFLKKLGYKNTKGILYPKMRHEILNETNNKQVLKDILKFIAKP